MSISLIIGASGGIGSALFEQLELRGGTVRRLSRREDGLDVTDEDSVKRAAIAIEDESCALIINATGALSIQEDSPEKRLDDIDPAAMQRQFALNALGPALLLKHFWPKLTRDRAVFASLSARVGSIGDNRLGGWISYRAAKSAQNQIVHTAAIEISRNRPESIVVALHPGTVVTKLTRKYLDRHPAVEATQAAGMLLDVIDSLTRADNGGFFDQHGKPVPW